MLTPTWGNIRSTKQGMNKVTFMLCAKGVLQEKFQIPTSNIQKNSKHQTPNTKHQTRSSKGSLPMGTTGSSTISAGLRPKEPGGWNLELIWSLVFGVWNFSGCWMLEFGI